MKFRSCVLLCFIFLLCFAPAFTQSVTSPAAPAVRTQSSAENALAEALVKAMTEEEQEQLLSQEQGLVNRLLLEALKRKAEAAAKNGADPQALKTYQLLARIAERIGDRRTLGSALTNVGAIYLAQNRHAQALDPLQRGLVLSEESGNKEIMVRALFMLGNVHRAQNHPDQALAVYHRGLTFSEKQGDKSLTARIANNIGTVYVAQGDYERALEFYQRSQALDEAINGKTHLALVFMNLGKLYLDQGRYAQALEYLQKSVRINEEIGSAADKEGIAVQWNNIALVYRRQGSYEQALEYYRKSLKLFEEINDQGRIATSQNNIGVVYKSEGLLEQSLEWFQKSLKIYEAFKDNAGVAMTLNNLGDVYRRQGRFELALELLRQSLQFREESGNRVGIARTLNNLSLLYQDQGNYTEMLNTSRRAARLAEEGNAPEDLWEAQESMGRALRVLKQPAEARQSFLAAIATIESLRYQVAGGGQQQQSFLENRLSPWLGLIALLVTQQQGAEALVVAEQSKARVLLDVLQTGRPAPRNSLSSQEQKEEAELRRRLVTLNSQLTSEVRRNQPAAARVSELKASIAKGRLEYEALETNLYVAHPELKVQRGEAPVIKAEELAALLPDATSALLEYVVADEQTYLFVLTKKTDKATVEMNVYPLPIKRPALTAQIDTLRQQLATRDLGFRTAARQLYQLLLQPAQTQLQGKTKLVIVPDDKLWELPFQALLAANNRYVLENSAISYAPSLTVLREMQKQRQANVQAGTMLFALGNPAPGRAAMEPATLALRSGNLASLPEAEQEVKALGQLYGTTRSKVYIGATAREDLVKNEARQARVLHFATHGTLNNATPLYSHLVMAQGDNKEDGLLEAWELMQMDLHADLAVLSACETAGGRYGAGEGMIGLSWALFVAGVPSTVVSQWKVEAASTRDLMLQFHRGLQNGKLSKAEALRQASLSLLKQSATNHPFYWAGFVLVGNQH